MAEPGSEVVRELMDAADGWYACRIGFLETVRAIALSAGRGAARAFEAEWPAFAVVEVDQALVEHAAQLARTRGLRSLDALHLASAVLVSAPDLTVATWDRRLHAAAAAEGLDVTPVQLS